MVGGGEGGGVTTEKRRCQVWGASGAANSGFMDLVGGGGGRGARKKTYVTVSFNYEGAEWGNCSLFWIIILLYKLRNVNSILKIGGSYFGSSHVCYHSKQLV